MKFQFDAVLDNASTGGLYVRLPRRAAVGARLFIVIWLSSAVSPQGQRVRPGVAVRGEVLRSEPQPGGEWGVALEIIQHRFL